MSCIVVLFPAPLAPTKAVVSPALITTLRLSKIWWGKKKETESIHSNSLTVIQASGYILYLKMEIQSNFTKFRKILWRKRKKKAKYFYIVWRIYKCRALFSITGRQILIFLCSCCSSLRTSQVNTIGELGNKSPLKNTVHVLWMPVKA